MLLKTDSGYYQSERITRAVDGGAFAAKDPVLMVYFIDEAVGFPFRGNDRMQMLKQLERVHKDDVADLEWESAYKASVPNTFKCGTAGTIIHKDDDDLPY